jgi:LmbE family N-acetylglucosaminyl deacetylase
MILVLLVIFLLLLCWIGGLYYSNDFSLPTKDLRHLKGKKVLVIFPHADDEVFTMGGLLTQLSRIGSVVTWLVLTKGEKGTPDGQIDDRLKDIRMNEAKQAAHIYGSITYLQKGYPDGGVADHRKELTSDLAATIEKLNPNLILTYDRSGLYGHPDHIAVSEVVTEIATHYPEIALWYASFPKRVLDSITLPIHMAKDKQFLKRRVYPTHKIWVGNRGIISKIRASKGYQSQGGSSSRNMPIKWIPMWFYLSLTPFEYFHEVKKVILLDHGRCTTDIT